MISWGCLSMAQPWQCRGCSEGLPATAPGPPAWHLRLNFSSLLHPAIVSHCRCDFLVAVRVLPFLPHWQGMDITHLSHGINNLPLQQALEKAAYSPSPANLHHISHPPPVPAAVATSTTILCPVLPQPGLVGTLTHSVCLSSQGLPHSRTRGLGSHPSPDDLQTSAEQQGFQPA